MSGGTRSNRSKSLVKGKAVVREEERESQRISSGSRKERAVIDISSDSLSWDAPFDLDGLPIALRAKLVSAAPCLLGRVKAVYDANFFHRVVGLCKEGISPKEVTDAMVPPSLYEDEWVCGEGANKTRYMLEKCKNRVARELFLMQYQRVYGDVLDNKAISLTFLRACVYYYQDQANKVNWAAFAAKVIADRRQHPGNNPLKMGPPALKNQMMGIVRECASYLSKHVGNEGGNERVGSGRGEGVGDNRGEGVGEGGGGGGAAGDGCGNSGTRKVEKLLKEIEVRTKVLQQSTKALEEMKNQRDKCERAGRDLEAEDERLNDMKDELRLRSKQHAAAGELTAKADCDKQQRVLSKRIAENNDLLERNQLSLEEMDKCLGNDRRLHEEIANDLIAVQKKCALEKAAQFSIKPKQPVGNKVSELGVAPDINLSAPCGCCSQLFVANCAVPFSCGCLFHPWCLWAELLSGSGVCPRCKKQVDSSWLESWGCEGLQQTGVGSKAAVEEASPPSSSFIARKRDADGNVGVEPPAKLTKPKDSIPFPTSFSGKSSSQSMMKKGPKNPITRFDFLTGRAGRSVHTEAVAAAVALLAKHTEAALESQKKVKEQAKNVLKVSRKENEKEVHIIDESSDEDEAEQEVHDVEHELAVVAQESDQETSSPPLSPVTLEKTIEKTIDSIDMD